MTPSRPVSLIEIEHDIGAILAISCNGPAFVHMLLLYLACPSPERAVALESFGVRVIMGRHDSERVRVMINPVASRDEKG